MRFLAGFITIMCGYRFSVQTSPLPAPRRTILIAGTLALSGVVLAAEVPTIDLARWTAPDIATVGDDPLGKLVKYGHALVTDTANRIGPTVSDRALRFAGNNLNCQSCHLKGGTQAYAMPLVGVWGQFPQYRGREGDVVPLEVRINGCLERSMNGRALPFDAPEMKAFLAYTKMALRRHTGWSQARRCRHAARQRARPRRGSPAWRQGLRRTVRGLPRREWAGPARRKRGGISFPALVGARQLQ